MYINHKEIVSSPKRSCYSHHALLFVTQEEMRREQERHEELCGLANCIMPPDPKQEYSIFWELLREQ